jgi:hypothetical protein
LVPTFSSKWERSLHAAAVVGCVGLEWHETPTIAARTIAGQAARERRRM